MSKSILIAPGDSELADQLTRKAVASGRSVITTSPDAEVGVRPRKSASRGRETTRRRDAGRRQERAGGKEEVQKGNAGLIEPSKANVEVPATGENPRIVRWNAKSLISPRNVVLAAANAWEKIDEAVLIHSTTLNDQALHNITPVAIETFVDSLIKGQLFLLRELLKQLLKQQSGSLALVLFSPEEFVTSPLQALSTSGFRSLAESLFSIYANETFHINAFETERRHPADFADYILDCLDERAATSTGKWYRLGSHAMPLFRRTGR